MIFSLTILLGMLYDSFADDVSAPKDGLLGLFFGRLGRELGRSGGKFGGLWFHLDVGVHGWAGRMKKVCNV